MHVLITRPRDDALALRADLEALGYSTIVEPLLTIERIDQPLPSLDDVQAIALTSAHAASALDAKVENLPIYTVGEATAEAARSAGCKNVHSADGNALDLAGLIMKACLPDAGVILHLAGEVVRAGLAETLTEHDFDVQRHATYRAVPCPRLSDELIASWSRHEIDAVLLFSPRTSAIMVRLLKKHGLESHVDSTAAICLSEETAMPCRALTWRTICPAAQPNQQALIRALEGSCTIC